MLVTGRDIFVTEGNENLLSPHLQSTDDLDNSLYFQRTSSIDTLHSVKEKSTNSFVIQLLKFSLLLYKSFFCASANQCSK
jgi:hypothetical protein